MNVLHIIRHGHIGGCETHLLELLRNVNKREFNPVVVSFSSGQMVDQLKAQGIPCQVWGEGSYSLLAISRKIKRMVATGEIDLIHTHDRKASNAALYASYQLKIPMIYGAHCWSFYQRGSWLRKYLLRQNERFLVHQSSMNIAASEISQEEGIRYLDMPNSIVIPHGVDVDRFSPERPTKLSRRVFGIPESYTVVGFLARLTRQKDPITFLRAAALALREDPKLHFLIIGDGILRNNCREEIERLGIANNVTFESMPADAAELLKLFDIYCAPSHYEGLSIGILEAMAMKKAIIASPVNGTLEVIANNIDGMLVSAGTPENWKETIMLLHRDPNLRKELGQRARMLVEEHYNIKNTAEKVMDVYRLLTAIDEEQQTEFSAEDILHSV